MNIDGLIRRLNAKFKTSRCSTPNYINSSVTKCYVIVEIARSLKLVMTCLMLCDVTNYPFSIPSEVTIQSRDCAGVHMHYHVSLATPKHVFVM